MIRYNEELLRAGALLAGDGLTPPSAATRVTFSPAAPARVSTARSREAKELVGGYWIIQARSHEEAVEWAARAPIGDGRSRCAGSPRTPTTPQAVADARRSSIRPPEQTVSD